MPDTPAAVDAPRLTLAGLAPLHREAITAAVTMHDALLTGDATAILKVLPQDRLSSPARFMLAGALAALHASPEIDAPPYMPLTALGTVADRLASHPGGGMTVEEAKRLSDALEDYVRAWLGQWRYATRVLPWKHNGPFDASREDAQALLDRLGQYAEGLTRRHRHALSERNLLDAADELNRVLRCRLAWARHLSMEDDSDYKAETTHEALRRACDLTYHDMANRVPARFDKHYLGVDFDPPHGRTGLPLPTVSIVENAEIGG